MGKERNVLRNSKPSNQKFSPFKLGTFSESENNHNQKFSPFKLGTYSESESKHNHIDVWHEVWNLDWTNNFERLRMLSNAQHDLEKWLAKHEKIYGKEHLCHEEMLPCKVGIFYMAVVIQAAQRQYPHVFENELSQDPKWIMWKYSWMNKSNANRISVHSKSSKMN